MAFLGTTTLVILSGLFGLGIFLIIAAFAVPSVQVAGIVSNDTTNADVAGLMGTFQTRFLRTEMVSGLVFILDLK